MSEGRAAAVARLRHMVEAADAIIGYTARGREAFDRDAALQDSTVAMVVGPSITTTFTPAEVRGWWPSVDTSWAYTRVDGPRSGSDFTDVWLDRFGAPRQIRDALSRITVLGHHPLWPAAVSRVQYPDGRVLRAEYNTMGLVASVTDSSLCQGGRCATTSYDYHAKWGFVTMIAPPEADTAFFRYNDTTGNRTLEFNVRRDTVKYYYGNTLKLLSSIARPGQAQRDSVAYDYRGNLQTARRPSGLVTTFVNDGFGFLQQKTTPGGVVTTTARDYRTGLDTLVRTSGPARSLSDYWENMVWPADTLSLRKLYDQEGNLIETQRHATGDAVGTLVEHTRYDRANRPVAVVAVDGKKDSVRYDEAGNRVELITRRGHSISQVFDLAGQLTQRRVPAVTTYTQQQWLGLTWPALPIPGDTLRFSYDDAGRDTLAVNRYAQIRRRYEKGGLLTWEEQRIRSWAQRTASTWSSAGFDVHVYPLTYDYDLDGRRTSLGHPPALGPGTNATTFTYHPFGAVATITDPYGGEFEFFWDQQGRLDSLTRPTTYAIGEKRRYDVDGRLQYRTVRTTHPSSGYVDNVINADTISYSADGLVTFAHDGREADSLNYTGLGQVGRTVKWYWGQHNGDWLWLWLNTEYFEPDAMGNIVWRRHATVSDPYVQQSYSYDLATGRLAEQGDLYWGDWYDDPLTYDDAGNQRYEAHWKLAQQCTVGDALTCSQWTTQHKEWFAGSYYDAEQHLVGTGRQTSMSLPNGDQVGGWESYWYDAYGRRILRGWWSQGYMLYPGEPAVDNHLYRYVWDGSQLLYEIRSDYDWSPDNDLQASSQFGRVGYVHGPGIDSPLEAFRADGALDFSRMFLHPSWRGTITQGSVYTGAKDGWPDPMIDWSRRNVTTYGQRGLITLTEPYRFFYGSLLDRQWDGSGLQYMRNRYYDPESGRFTQEDPIGLAGGLNLYGFANGDPVNFSDPFGLRPDDIYYDEYGRETMRVKTDTPDRHFLVLGGETYRLDYGLVAGTKPYKIHANLGNTYQMAQRLAAEAPQYGQNQLAVGLHSLPGGTLDFKKDLPGRSLWFIGGGMFAHKQAPGNMAWGNYMARQGFSVQQSLTGGAFQGNIMAGGEDPFDQRMIARGFSLYRP